MTNIVPIKVLKQRNLEAGQFFFSEGAMRFFNSTIESDGFECGPDLLFVTSEQGDNNWDGLRRYTIRRMDARGCVTDFSEFGEFQTAQDAYTAMFKAANSD